MAKQKLNGTEEVTNFLSELNHPLKKEIEQIRKIVLGTNKTLTENIKWNAPNFCFEGEDRITMRIYPPKQIQIIFHRGAKVQKLQDKNLIADDKGLLIWKTTDRAVVTFANMADIKLNTQYLIEIINNWLTAAAITK
jgi:hypothetical protein